MAAPISLLAPVTRSTFPACRVIPAPPCMQHPGTGREMLYGIRRAVTHARSVMIIGASGCAMLVG
jgi:hypothetical protein